jgi:hypothetical protein
MTAPNRPRPVLATPRPRPRPVLATPQPRPRAMRTPQPQPPGVITKDFCTYTTEILHDHAANQITARSAAAAARMEA